jgi:hypothetical protein
MLTCSESFNRVFSQQAFTFLKLICSNYLDILSKDVTKVTLNKIEDALKIITSGKLAPESKVINLFMSTKMEALSLKLEGGDHAKCEAILIEIIEIFAQETKVITPQDVTAFLPGVTEIFQEKGQSALLQIENKKMTQLNQSALLQESKENMKQELMDYIKQGFSKAAKIQFDGMKGSFTLEEQNKLLHDVFAKTALRSDIPYLRKVVQQFNIDVKSLSFILDEENKTHSPLELTLGLKDIKTQKEYLTFLNGKGVNVKSEEDSFRREEDSLGFPKVERDTLLALACSGGDRNLVELLLNEWGADINLSYKSVRPDKMVVVCNPFHASFTSMDIELVKYLVEKGADPIKWLSLAKKWNPNLPVQKKYVPQEDEFLASSYIETSNSNSNKKWFDLIISNECLENLAFVQQYYLLIEECIKKDLTKLVEASISHDVPTLVEPKVKSSKPTKVVLETAPDPQEKIPELLSMYIGVKEGTKNLSNEKTVNIEDEFDILLLKFCQTASEQELEAVHEYIAQNPELNHYVISSLLKTAKPAKVAQDVLMYQQKLLHKFFEVKKQFDATSSKEQPAIVEKGYKVQSNLQHDAYVDIAPKLKCILEENYKDYYKKLQEALVNCKFIKADSQGMSGIKTYGGIIKFKVAGENWEIMTHTKYLDKSGNTLIIFDQIIDHKDKPTGDLETIKLDNFISIWAQLMGDSEDQSSALVDHHSELIGSNIEQD